MTGEHPTLLLGAYVLAALEPAERAEVDAHVRRCPACAAEVGELMPLRDLLAQLGPDEVHALAAGPAGGPPAPSAPPADLFPRLVAAVQDAETDVERHPAEAEVECHPRARGAADRAARLPLQRRPRLLLAAAAVLLLIGAGAGSAAVLAHGGAHPGATISATAGTVRMTVALAADRPGTRLKIDVAGLPVNEQCTLIAVARDGSRHPAGRWTATYAGSATVTTSTDVARPDLRRLVLLGTTGQTLLQLDL